MANKLRSLYNVLSFEHPGIGSFEEFSKNVLDPVKSKEVFDAALSSGFKYSSYDDFKSRFVEDEAKDQVKIEPGKGLFTPIKETKVENVGMDITDPFNMAEKTQQPLLISPTSSVSPGEYPLSSKTIWENHAQRLEEKRIAEDPVYAASKAIDRGIEETSYILPELDKSAAQAEIAQGMDPRMIGAKYQADVDKAIAQKSTLATANEMFRDAKAILEAPKKGAPVVNSWFKGMGETMSDDSFWTIGISAIKENADALKVINKLEKNQPLTDDENKLLDGIAAKSMAEYMRMNDTSAAFRGGKGTAEMLPFIAQMAMTSGIGGVALKAGEKALVTAIGERIASMVGQKLATYAVKGGIKLTEAAIGATVAPMTIASTIDQMTGEARGEVSDGNVEFQGVDGQKDFLGAYGNSWVNTWKEFATEKAGGSLSVLGKVLTAVPGAEKLAAKFAETGIGKGLKTVGDLMSTKQMKDLGIHNFLGEYNEEFDSALFDHVFMGGDIQRDFLNWDAQAVLLYTLAPVSGVSMGINGVNNARLSQAYNSSNKEIDRVLLNNGYAQADIEEVKNALVSESPENVGKQIGSIVSTLDGGITTNKAGEEVLNKDLAQTFLKYAQSANVYAGYEEGVKQRKAKYAEDLKRLDPKTGIQYTLGEIEKDAANQLNVETTRDIQNGLKNATAQFDKAFAGDPGLEAGKRAILEMSLPVNTRVIEDKGTITMNPEFDGDKFLMESILEEEDNTPEQIKAIEDLYREALKSNEYARRLKNKVDEEIKKTEEAVKARVNQTTSTIVTVEMPDGSAADVMQGDVNADETVYVSNENGELVPMPSKELKVVSDLSPEEVIAQQSESVSQNVVAQEENDAAPGYNNGEIVRFTTQAGTFNGQVVDFKEGMYTIALDNGIQIAVEPRNIIDETNVRDVVEGDTVEYRDASGAIVSGVVDDMFSMRAEGIIGVDNNQIPIENILGKVNVTPVTVTPVAETPVTETVPEQAPEQIAEQKSEKAEYPRDKKGNIDYASISDPVMYADAITEEFPAKAEAIVNKSVNKAEERLAKSIDIEDPIAQAREEEAAQANLDFMKEVQTILNQRKDATEKRNIPESNLPEYQIGDESRQAAEAGDRNRVVEGGQGQKEVINGREVVKAEGGNIAKGTDAYAFLTEDGEGNYVFYHVGGEGYEVIRPAAGATRATSSGERQAISKVGGVAMYYTAENDGESMVSGPAKYMVKVPVEKVYPFNADPLNFATQAKERHDQEHPGKAYDANSQAAYITKIAAENGFDMTVVEWGNRLRAQTTKELTPVDTRIQSGSVITKDFENKYISNKDKGFEAYRPEPKNEKLVDIYRKINNEFNSRNDYSTLYHLHYSYDNYTQDEVSALINESEKLSDELKAEYNNVVNSLEEKRATLYPAMQVGGDAVELANTYKERLSKLKEENPELYWSVDIPSDEIIQEAASNGRLVDVNGGMGIVTADGEMIGLFKYDPTAKGTANAVQKARIELGGNRLDVYDTNGLVDNYSRTGFREVARIKFNPEFAPEDMPQDIKDQAPDVVFMVYDPNNELTEDVKQMDDYDDAKEYAEEQANELMDENKAEATQAFFSAVVKGEDERFKPFKPWSPYLTFSKDEELFREYFEKFNGNFDTHISTSIPLFRDTQIKTGNAILRMFEKSGGLVYDIGGSEGGYVKAITEASNGNIRSINLDPNPDMVNAHNAMPVEGSEVVAEAFYSGWTETDNEGNEVEFKAHTPKETADVVHESMTFQFIRKGRTKFIREVKDKYLKPGGLFITEEKLLPDSQDQYTANEAKKDRDFKLNHYTEEQLKQKGEQVLTGMKKNQTRKEAYLRVLRNNFAYVFEYWDSGNFKGYVATDDLSKAEEFLGHVGSTDTEFSEKNISAAPKSQAETAVQDKQIIKEESANKESGKMAPISQREFNALMNQLAKTQIAEIATGEEFKTMLEKITSNEALQVLNEMQSIKDAAIANGTFMQAPNGEHTKLNENQWLQVRTTSFKNWFGDWENDPQNASKIIDENGEPMAVYHGSWTDKFTEFKETERGIYFTNSKEAAETYSMGFEGKLYTTFLNIRNPLSSDYSDEESDAGVIDDFKNAIKSGNDGVIATNTFDGEVTLDQYVVAKANQIKSAISNNGEFDPNNSDIRMQVVQDNLGFYSTVEMALDKISQQKGTKDQFKAMLLKNGAKQAEMDWMGFEDLPEKLTKDDLVTWINENKIKIEEVELSSTNTFGIEKARELFNANQEVYVITDQGNEYLVESEEDLRPNLRYATEDMMEGNGEVRFEKYTIPGGRDYKEILLTMPYTEKGLPVGYYVDSVKYSDGTIGWFAIGGGIQSARLSTREAAEEELMRRAKNLISIREDRAAFKSSHFDQKNILAHLRLDIRDIETDKGERVDYEGTEYTFGVKTKPVLFIEEFQSDWAQEGRKKGFRSKFKPEDVKFYTESDFDIAEDYVKIAIRHVVKRNMMEVYNLKPSMFKESDLELKTVNGEQAKRPKEDIATIDKWIKNSGIYAAVTSDGIRVIDKKHSKIKYSRPMPDFQEWKDKVTAEQQEEAEDRFRRENGNLTPDMPFKKTDQWLNLTMRRALKYAVENGIETIAWTTGRQQADRYGLARYMSSIKYMKNENGLYNISAFWQGGANDFRTDVTKERLEELYGVDISNQIESGVGENDEGPWTYLYPKDFSVGGEGMISFYDNIVPNAFNKLGKPFGVSVKEIQIKNTDINTFEDQPYLTQQSITITPEMKEAIMGGMPLFLNIKGTVYGFALNGKVYVNPEKMNANTPIHEFGHVWLDIIEQKHNDLFLKGEELVKKTPYFEQVMMDQNYAHLDERGKVKEALARAIGDNGEQVVQKTGIGQALKNWISDVWKRIGQVFYVKNLTPEQISRLTFKDFIDIANAELLGGEKLFEEAPKAPEGIKLHSDFVVKKGNFFIEYLKNQDKFRELTLGDDPLVTRNKQLADFNGSYMVLHSPDFAFSGNIYKDGKLIVEGKGGVYYPILFKDKGYVWAATAGGGGTSFANLVNEAAVISANKGQTTVKIALSSGGYEKILNSPVGTSAVLTILKEKVLDPKFLINKTSLKNALIEAGKDVGVTGLKPSMSFEYIFEAVSSKATDQAIPFKNRAVFISTLFASLTKELSGTKAEEQLVDWMSKGINNEGFKGISGKSKRASRQNMVQAFSYLLAEPTLKRFIDKQMKAKLGQETDNSEIYAVIETDINMEDPRNTVKVVASKDHPSYPSAIKMVKKGKTRVHILQDSKSWLDVFRDPITGRPVRELNASQRSGVMFAMRGLSYKPLELIDQDYGNPEKVDFQIIGEKGASRLDEQEEVNTRLNDLELAKKLRSLGFTARDIKMQTGWEFKSVDQKWKYEVADYAPTHEILLRIAEGEELTLKEMAEASGSKAGKDLVAAYPVVGAMKVKEMQLPENVMGRYDSKNNVMIMSRQRLSEYLIGNISLEEIQATFVHEVQHTIQSDEGFAAGQSYSTLSSDENKKIMIEAVDNQARKWTREQMAKKNNMTKINKLVEGGMSAQQAIEKVLDAAGFKKVMSERNRAVAEINSGRMAADLYWRAAGEVEARNVSERMKMSDKERRETLMTATEDVMFDEQLSYMDALGVSDDMESIANVGGTPVNMRNELSKKNNNLWGKLVEGHQNNMRPVLFFQKMLEANGTEISDQDNYYMKYTSVGSKIQFAVEQFEKNLFEPLKQTIAKLEALNLAYDQVGAYVQLKHADEYDAVMRAKGKVKTDKNLAGKEAIEQDFDINAEEFIKFFENVAGEETIKTLWKQIKAVTDFSLNQELKSGKLSRENYDKIRSMFEYYVPLRGHMDMTAEDKWPDSYRHGEYFVPAVKEAKGRTSAAKDSFAYMRSMAISAIHSAENNILNQNLLRLAFKDKTGIMKAGKQWFVKTGEQDGKPVFEPAEEVELLESDTQEEYNDKVKLFEEEMARKAANGEAYRSGDAKLMIDHWIKPGNARKHEVTVWRNGMMYTIKFNTDPRVPEAINGENMRNYIGAWGTLLEKVGNVTRFMAAAKTMFRPAFIFITNPLRDFHMAFNLNFIDQGAGFTAKFASNIPMAISSLVKYYTVGYDPINNKYDKMLWDYMQGGAKTGKIQMLEINDIEKLVRKDIKRMGKGKINKLPHGAWSLFEKFYGNAGAITENQMRFATYITAIQEGMSKDRAIAMAKDVTVNFDRKGSGRNLAKELRSLKAFYNVGWQALDNLYTKSAKSKANALRSSAVVFGHIATGYFLMTSLNSLVAAMLGEDDDEWKDLYANVPEFTRNSNLMLYAGKEKGFISIPLGQELRMYHGLGSDLFLWQEGKVDDATAALNLLNGISSLVSYNPVEKVAMGQAAQLTPDIVQPIAEMAVNKNFLGSRIYDTWKADLNMPGYKKIRVNKKGEPFAEDILIEWAKDIDQMTGGDGVIPGKVSLNPDKVGFLLGGYFAGLYTQFIEVANVIGSEEDDKVKKFITPKSLYKPAKNIMERADFGGYYELTKQIKEKEDYLKAYIKSASLGEITQEEAQAKIEALGYDQKARETSAMIKAVKRMTDMLDQIQPEEQDAWITKINNLKKQIMTLNKEASE